MASRSRYGLLVLLHGLVIVLLSLFFFAHSESADAIPLHEVSVSLQPDELFAKVTISQLGAVTFDGNLTIEKPQGVERVTVTLTAETSRGWHVSVSPQTIPFINPGTEHFEVTVIVPRDTPPVSGTVTVHAVAHNPIWDEEATCEATVTVLQYYKFYAWIEDDVENVRPGESVIGRLRILNNGTGEDTFHISLESVPDVITSWNLPEYITIPSKIEMDVEFTLNIDPDYSVPFEGKMFTIVIKVVSEGARGESLLYEKSSLFFLYFEGLEGTIVSNWPTYLGYGVAVALIVTVTFIILRKRRRGLEDVPEMSEG